MTREEILETDIFDQLCKIPYVRSAEDLAVESALLEYYNSIKVDDVSAEALSLILQDIYIGDAIDKVKGTAIKFATKAAAVGNRLASFARYIQTAVTNKIVSEKFIRKRFDSLKTVYVNFFYKELADKSVYIEAPTYDTMSKRLMGLHNAVTFLKNAANSQNISDVVTIDTYAKVASLTNGVLTVKSSEQGLVNHLVWTPPTIERYTVVDSPFQKVENIDNLCNTLLFVKYKAMDGVQEAVKSCLKRTSKLKSEEDNYVSYDVDDETAEQHMHDYSVAYMVTKMLNDVVKQGIQREVNTAAINYVHKLKTFKRED